jgi:exodeoxyribonuclease V beta subunit
LLERRLKIEEILIVTFTEAATQELQARLRSRLKAALDCLSSGQSEDPFFQAWLLPKRGDPALVGLLRQALADMDLARISTIHAFCQWALSRFPLRSAQALQFEVISDQRLLLSQAIEDFWRKQIYRPEVERVLPILDAGWSPECLVNQALPLLGLHGLKLLHQLQVEQAAEQDCLGADWQLAHETFSALYFQAQALWRSDRSDILAEASQFKGKSFQLRFLPSRATALDGYFSHPEPHLPEDDHKLNYFALDQIVVSQSAFKPEHSFFACIEALRAAALAWAPLSEALRLRWLRQCMQAVKAQLQRGKKARQQLSFDDLLWHLHTALQDPEHGEGLAEALRQAIPVALIDEFQDTDSLQSAIFKRIYPEGPLFLIGDPKQSIYAFRGADIQAYLQIRKGLPEGALQSLDTNFRSQKSLLRALEVVFEREHPFADPAIEFVPVASGAKAEHWQAPPGDAPLEIAWIPTQADLKPWPKDKLQFLLPRAVAAEIAHMLSAYQYQLHDAQSQIMRPLLAQDIAVLVRTHAQGQHIREALQRLGIPSVLYAQETVFNSPEAAALETFLQAVLQPSQRGAVLQALAGPLVGLSATDLYLLQTEAQTGGEPNVTHTTQSAQSWEYWLTHFQLARQNWSEHGFARMWSEWVSSQGLYRRLLSGPEGERQVTNLRHLSELLQSYALNQNASLQALVAWLARERQAGRLDQENLLLQLETDRHAVQILTIHRSKGLEFPVVFCPYLWDGKKILAQAPLRANDPDTRQPLLDLGSEHLAERAKLRQAEALQEDLRLAYVALTRARYKLWLAWGWANQLEFSALGHLFSADSGAALLAQLEAAAARSEGTWQIQTLDFQRGDPVPAPPALPLESLKLPAPPALPLESLKLPAPPRIPPVRVARSFSALQAQFEIGLETGLLLPWQQLEQQDESAETESEAIPLSPDAPAEGPLMDFPRGGRHGTFLHWLLETLIPQPVPEILSESLPESLTQALLRHGYEADWQVPLAAALGQIWQSPLTPLDFNLAAIAPARRLPELAFQFPIQGHLRSQALMQVLQSSQRWAHLPDLDDRPLRGQFKGVIDLVCEHQGRYYVVDYKSNWLGRRYSDYRPEALERALTQHLYPLQYHLYLVALHRYLRYRLPDYSPEGHLGGALVLFLRGMNPALPGNGVFFEAPDPALILELSHRFGAEK